jgi:N6-adenosine-specific RNA methylase IME4
MIEGPLGTRKYSIIYADPPWRFQTFSPKGRGRSAEQHYDCMSFIDLCRVPVRSITKKDAALFLWVTDPMLQKGIELMEEWGFRYKTVAFTWAKLNKKSPTDSFVPANFHLGSGYWTRANTELCLLGTQGSPKRQSKSVRRLVISPRREHSRKPDEIATAIVELIGDVPRIELFARTKRHGWDNWGLETEKFS